jgi:hypothetical protein
MRHDGQKISQIHQKFQFMEHLALHELHDYQFSQEIT